MILNLCQNGIQAMKGEGVLTVSTRQSPVRMGSPGVAFLVKDEGPGFSKSAKENLFVPFYTTKRGGTGLGLAEPGHVPLGMAVAGPPIPLPPAHLPNQVFLSRWGLRHPPLPTHSSS